SGGIPGWTWALTREGMSAGEAAAVVGARALVTSVFFVVAGAVGVAVVPARATGASGAGLWGVGALVLVFAAVAAILARPAAAARSVERVLGSRSLRRLVGEERADRLAEGGRREALHFAEGLRSLVRERPGALAVALAGMLVSRACLLAILPVVLAGLGWRGDPVPILVTVLGVWALASASPTPGGSGAVEAAMTAVLSRLVPLETAGAAALLWRGTTFYFDLLVGWVLFSRYLAGRRG
ncbi:MAG: lysylphosphatidylglycerol synthase transmembrane domain-containing protein, partial [Coriobacteriia bacterium]|nr:lysylphosphatidylglycerol synthase transmembrane domain-containing protein [Coriobacteriia bacterium]